ncbi:probable myosin-binding protein 4 [Sesamum indicum]|uniref:Probable myosin-binding protein 4 n=1 Tax=Sesamum indicum TaxID=4182 RepID=A0A6I9TH59_SESIN|nr:probable myosin-binding protein 4 [Sesamum indicum]
MAAESSSVRRRKPHGFMTLLSSAACEWFLMFLMFVNAAFSYLLTRFAQYCELETPCLLCSRLDFGKRKPGSYWSLLCSSHREEISSVVSCSVHGKFADVHGMCEECLMPIATRNKRNSESYRLLVGKSWVDVDRSVLQSLMLNKNIVVPPDSRMCSCCNKPWRAKSNAERLLEPGLVGLGASKANVKPPLPRAPGRSRFSRRDSLKRIRDKASGAMGNSVDTLCHVGYTKLKISSDSESEVPISEDDDDGNTGSHGVNRGEILNVVQCDRKVLDQPNLVDPSEQKYMDSSSSDAFKQHVLGDLDWRKSCNEPSPSLKQKLTSLENGSQVSDVVGPSVGQSAETCKSAVSLNHMLAIHVPPEPLPFHNVPSLVAAKKGDASVVKDIEATAGTSSNDAHLLDSSNLDCNDALTRDDETQELFDKHELEPVNKCDSAKIEENVKIVPQIPAYEVGLLSNDTSPRAHDEDDKSGIDEDFGSEVLPVSGSDKHEFEPVNKCDSAKTVESLEIEENVKIVPQISAYEVGLLSNETSPRAHDKDDKPRIDEDAGSQVLPVSGSPTTNESDYEALVGITVSYIEGESIVDILKRQIEHDRNIINSLYKELEEERNAAAIAANQAMAMITRLQEEKATLHMEALHYLRMMDEQAEYDMEALERANELLAERDKELQDMEIELDFYRSNLLDEQEVYNVQKETSIVYNQVAAHTENIPKLMNSSASNLDDEKHSVWQGLKKLETHLHQAHLSGKLDGLPYVLNPEKIKVELANLEELPPNGETLNQKKEEDGSVVHKVIPLSNGNYSQDGALYGNPTQGKENVCLHQNSDNFSANQGEINSSIVDKEIAELHDRLEALQKHQNLHKHASELLRNGKNGTQVVQELAHQIHELRKIEVQR